ncbi:MAG TPA: arylesterase [Gemmatimonadales bacterium]|nr:arylesterase [Gemmatimonadales bacterium]
MQGTYTKAVLIVSLLASCGGTNGAPPARQDSSATAAVARVPSILVLGTSLTAGYGIDISESWPSRLQKRIDSAGLSYRVVNAGVSGETSAGALRRADWVLTREHPKVLVLETGGNDGLRGLDPDTLKANILGVFAKARALTPQPALVLLAMEAPPNLGDTYTRRFRAVYEEAARETGATLVPFFLDGIAGVDSLNQSDGIHPNARGADRAAANVWKILPEVLRPAP